MFVVLRRIKKATAKTENKVFKKEIGKGSFGIDFETKIVNRNN